MPKIKQIMFIYSVLLFSALAQPGLVLAQRGSISGGRGGGTISDSTLGTIEFFLAPGSDYLKKSLINYLNTIDPSKISDPTVLRVLGDPRHVAALRRDIHESRYHLGQPGECRDHEAKIKTATAGFGERGGDICFDPEEVLREVETMNDEGIMIALAALAAHEHQHHLQANPGGDPAKIASLEAEARALATYIRATARTTDVPVLQWRLPVPEVGRNVPFFVEYEAESSLLKVGTGRGPYTSLNKMPATLSDAEVAANFSHRPRLAARIMDLKRRFHGRQGSLEAVFFAPNRLGCLRGQLRAPVAIRIRAQFYWDQGYIYDSYGVRYYIALFEGTNRIAEIESREDQLWNFQPYDNEAALALYNTVAAQMQRQFAPGQNACSPRMVVSNADLAAALARAARELGD